MSVTQSWAIKETEKYIQDGLGEVEILSKREHGNGDPRDGIELSRA